MSLIKLEDINYPTNKEEIINLEEQFIQIFTSGETDKKPLYVKLKGLEILIKNVLKRKEVRKGILDECEREGKKTFTTLECTWQIKEGKPEYDYSQCNSITLPKLYAKLEELKEDIKKEETFLKNLSGEVYNEEGVLLQKPTKTSETIVAVTLL